MLSPDIKPFLMPTSRASFRWDEYLEVLTQNLIVKRHSNRNDSYDNKILETQKKHLVIYFSAMRLLIKRKKAYPNITEVSELRLGIRRLYNNFTTGFATNFQV